MRTRHWVWAALLLWIVANPAFSAQRGQPEDVGGIPDDKAFKEDAVTLPAYPQDAGLAEFRPRGASNNRYYIDLGTISLGEDRVVRYTAVVRSPSGASNVSYEGLRCKDAHYKTYAFGTREGAWIPARNPDWKALGVSVTTFQYSLYKDYFCDLESVAGRNARDLRLKVKDHFPQKSNTTKR